MRLLPTKRGWIRFAIGLASLIALALIANGFMAWRTETRLRARIAAIRAAGDPASIADLAPEPIPADENAAAILASVETQLDQFGRDHAAFNSGPEGEIYSAIETQGVPATKEQIETVRKVLNRYPEIDKAISDASTRIQYASLADFSVGPRQFLEATIENVQVVRSVGRFVPLRMQILAADSEPESAIQQGIAFLNLTRLYESEPLLTNFLVAIAMRGVAIDAIQKVLNQHPVSAGTHAELERALSELDDPQRLPRVLKTDRAFGVATAVESGQGAEAGQGNSVLWQMFGWPIKSLYVDMLGTYEDQLKLADMPWHEIRDQISRNGSSQPSRHGVLADLLAPVLRIALETNARDLALIRALRIANALAAFRDEHGREASGLEDLSLPREATIDPFSGERLKVRHTDDGWIIYSVMKNGVDDGGDFKDLIDYGLAPRKRSSTQ